MIFKRLSLCTFMLALSAPAAAPARAEAGQTHEYVIAANDGYGLQDCLAGGAECGQVVADAWCRAHGDNAAVSYGPQSQFTEAATKISMAAEPYVINCRD
jgi:hypothetical protein